MEHIINPVYYQDFILSGKPEFTLRSLNTGNEQIFVVKISKFGDVYWVNNQLRQLLGTLLIPKEAAENVWVFQQKSKELLPGQQSQIDVFLWFWNNVLRIKPELHSTELHWIIPDKLKQIQIINHTGRCGRCHRPLDDPDSMKIGIGPDCFKKLGLTHKTLVV